MNLVDLAILFVLLISVIVGLAQGFVRSLSALAGLALGLASARYIATLLYEVKATEWGVIVIPAMTILLAAVLAAAPAVLRAVRIDPATMLRVE